MNPYFPYQNQFQQQYPINQYQNMQSQMQMQRQEVSRVSGIEGAKAFQIAPNSSVLLLDEQNPIVYLKTSDSGGYPSITAYSITPYKEEQQADVKSLESRIERLEKLYESNIASIERNETSQSVSENC